MSRGTVALAGALALLVLADVAAHRAAAPPPPLPDLPALAADRVARLEITVLEDHVALERRPDGWWLVLPHEERANARNVAAALEALERGITIDARAEAAPPADELVRYGLAPDQAAVVRAMDATGAELLHVYIGTGLGDANFLRLADDLDVYRGRVGGRGRFDRHISAWVDPRVMAVATDGVSRVVLTRPDGALDIVRTDGVWRLADDPAFPVDQPLMRSAVGALGAFESAEEVRLDDPRAAGASPLVEIDLLFGDGASRRLRFLRSQTTTWAGVDGEAVLHRTGPYLADILAGDRASFYDHQLARRPDATRISIDDGATEALLEPLGGEWRVVAPAGIATGADLTAQVARGLAQFRVESWLADPSTCNFDDPVHVTVSGPSGSDRFTIGAFGTPLPGERPSRCAHRADDPGRIGLIEAKAWAIVRQAVGR